MRLKPVHYRVPKGTIPTHSSEALFPEALSRSNLTFLTAPPTSGKTTLIKQALASLSKSSNPKPVLFFELTPHSTLNDINKELQLHFQNPSPSGTNTISTFEELLDHIESEESILIFDNISYLESPELILSLCETYFQKARLISTGLKSPSLSPNKLSSFSFVRHSGFSASEIQNLIEASPLYQSLPPSSQQMIHSVVEKSNGNPLLAKTLLAQIAENSFENSSTQITTSLELAQIQYWKIISERISPNDVKTLQKIALVEYSLRLRSEYMRELTPSTVDLLKQAGFIVGEEDQHHFSPFFNELISTSIRIDQRTAFRKEILYSLGSLNPISFSEQKERISQYLLLRDTTAAQKALEDTVHLFQANHSEKDFLSFSSQLASPSIALKEQEAEIRINLQQFDEIQARFKDDPDLLRSAILSFALGFSYRKLGRTQEAIEIYTSALELVNPTQVIYYRISSDLLTAQSFLSLPNVTDSFIALITAYKHHHLSDSQTIAETLFSYAIHLNRRNQSREAASVMEESVLHFRNTHSRIQTAYVLAELAVNYFNYGAIELAFSRLQEAETLAFRYGDFYLNSTVVNAKVYILARIGKHIDAERFFLSHLGPPHTLRNPIGPYFHALMNLFDSQVFARNFIKTIPNQFQSQQHRVRHVARSELIAAFQDPASHNDRLDQIIKQHSQLGETRLILALVILFELCFQSDFRFRTKTYANYKPKLPESLEDVDYCVLVKTLQGIYHLSEKRWSSSKELLLSGLSAASRFQLPLWIARAHLFLALLAFRDNDLTQTSQHLDAVRAEIPKFDPHPEFELLPVLEGALLVRNGNISSLLPHLAEFQPTLALTRYLKWKLETQFLGTKTPAPTATAWAETIFESLNLVHDPEVIVFHPKGKDSIRLSSIGRFLKPTPKLYLNFISNEFYFSGQNLDLNEKHTLLEVLVFLVKNSNKFFTKEELTHRVWREKYNPLVHDSRVYTSIKRLRTLLTGKTPKDEVIRTQKDAYGISAQTTYVVVEAKSPYSDLNPRQQWILNYLTTHDEVDRTTIETLLSVSATLVKSDLSELLERGLIVREGNARATKYRL